MCLMIFNGEDEDDTGTLHTKIQVLLNRMKIHWRQQMNIEDAISLQAPSELVAPLANEATASVAACDADREVVVRVRDLSDSVSNRKPGTRRPLDAGSQSSSEPVGAACDITISSGRGESDHEETAQPQKSSATTAALHKHG